MLLALEIVIKKGFVDAGFSRNLVCARARQAGLGELAFCGGHDGSASLRALRARSPLDLKVNMVPHHLTNWIVKPYQLVCQPCQIGSRGASNAPVMNETWAIADALPRKSRMGTPGSPFWPGWFVGPRAAIPLMSAARLLRLVQRDEAVRNGEAHQAGNRVDVEFAHNALAVSFDGAHAYAQSGGNLFIAAALGDQGKHFALAVAEFCCGVFLAAAADQFSQRGLGNFRSKKRFAFPYRLNRADQFLGRGFL